MFDNGIPADKRQPRPIQDTELANRWSPLVPCAPRSGATCFVLAHAASDGDIAKKGGHKMEVADLILPVFAIIVTGWLAGWLGYISRSLSDGLVHFAYNIAMPALLFITIAQEPADNLLEWRFLLAFGGGSILCFALVFLAVRAGWR